VLFEEPFVLLFGQKFRSIYLGIAFEILISVLRKLLLRKSEIGYDPL